MGNFSTSLGGTSVTVDSKPAYLTFVSPRQIDLQVPNDATGNSLGYPTIAAKAGDTVELFATGFGPTNPAVPAGQVFSGAAPTTNPVTILINQVGVTPSFAGLSGAGLCQINVIIPAGLGTGDVSLQATVGGATTPSGVVISLQ